MLSRFGNATWIILPTFIFCSLSMSLPSRRLSLSIANVVFQEQSAFSSTTTQIAVQH